MRIANTKKIRQRILDLMFAQKLNSQINKGILNPVDQGFRFIDYSELEASAALFREESHGEYTTDESLIAAAIINVLNDNPEENNDLPIPPLIINAIIKYGKIFHEGDIENNPYLKNIHFEKQTIGELEISSNSYAKYELLQYDAESIVHGVAIPKLAMFDHRFRFPKVRQNKTVRMSFTPDMIFTMEKPIEEATGNVLTLGCGMGYYAYMASLKPEVEHITIVEKDQNVIDLFTNVILPQFEYKDKITVVHGNPFLFMKSVEDGAYDCCFANIRWSYANIIPYIKLRQICDRFNKIKMSYWTDRLMRESVCITALTIILIAYVTAANIPTTEALPAPEQFTRDTKLLARALKDVDIKTVEDLDNSIDCDQLIPRIVFE